MDQSNAPWWLIDVADSLAGSHIMEVEKEAMEAVENGAFARVRLAIAFKKKPLSFQLRALVEGWNGQRIVREMY
jgi:hypothetical protein